MIANQFESKTRFARLILLCDARMQRAMDELLNLSKQLDELGGGDVRVAECEAFCVVCPVQPDAPGRGSKHARRSILTNEDEEGFVIVR